MDTVSNKPSLWQQKVSYWLHGWQRARKIVGYITHNLWWLVADVHTFHLGGSQHDLDSHGPLLFMGLLLISILMIKSIVRSRPFLLVLKRFPGVNSRPLVRCALTNFVTYNTQVPIIPVMVQRKWFSDHPCWSLRNSLIVIKMPTACEFNKLFAVQNKLHFFLETLVTYYKFLLWTSSNRQPHSSNRISGAILYKLKKKSLNWLFGSSQPFIHLTKTD